MSIIRPLVKLDYDGVVVVPQKNSFSIMREALQGVLADSNVYSRRFAELDWGYIFAQTSGTTEWNFVYSVLRGCDVPVTQMPSAFWRFINRRSALVREFNHDRGFNKFDDVAVFSDAEVLLENIKTALPESVVALVTGNPGQVIEERLPLRLRKYFDFWIGGEYGRTRGEMVNAALNHAVNFCGWKPQLDQGGGLINSFYFDDSLRAVIDVLKETPSRVVWVPRQEQSDYTLRSDLWEKVSGNFSLKDADRLFWGHEADYRNGETFYPRVVQANRLDDTMLINPRQKYYKGFLDPALHQKYVENARIWLEMESSSNRERV